MRTIKIAEKEHEQLKKLIRSYDEIYGDSETTIWNIDNLEELRKIGEEVLDVIRKRV